MPPGVAAAADSPRSLGARGATCTATPPAPPLPPFIKPGIYTSVCTPTPQQPWSSWARLRQRFIRINVALQRRVSVWRLPGVPGERVPSSPLSHWIKALQPAQSWDEHGQHMTELFSRAKGKQSILYSICSHVYRMSYYIVHGEDQSLEESVTAAGRASCQVFSKKIN